MAEETPKQGSEEPLHRGRIQAQGGGTEKSQPWAQANPPTADDLLQMVDVLEARLTAREKKDREQPLQALRRLLRSAAAGGGMFAPVSKSFLKRGSRDIRVDLEIIKGMACVPAPPSSDNPEESSS